MTELLKDRAELVERMPKNGVVAEIGVFQGGFSQKILDLAKPQSLYLIDCWQAQDSGEYASDPMSKITQERFDEAFKIVQDKFRNRTNVKIVKSYSDQAAKKYQKSQFDWIYIDANHTYKAFTKDIHLWFELVRCGGYVCGHDYTEKHKWIEVVPALADFMRPRGLTLKYLTTDEIESPSWCLKKEYLKL